jgi:hypothetical protein
MKLLSVRAALALGIGAGSGVLGVVAACSSGSSGSAGNDNSAHQIANGSSGSTGSSGSNESDGGLNNSDKYADATVVMYDGPPPNVDGGQLLCATPDGLPIKFNPMYSGFDGVHSYQIPTFVMGADPATVTWGSSDPSMVNFQPYVTGIMITTRKAGDVTIVATVGATCGSALLHITQYTVDEWNLGNARYNNGNPLNLSIDAAALKNCDASLGFDADLSGWDGNISGFDASGFDASGFDAAAELGIQQCIGNPFDTPPAACTNCHGDMSNGKLFGMTLFSDVSHTPEQTGGFSDQDLTNVFAHGTVPPGGYFDPSIVPYANWHLFHTWSDINTAEEQAGMTAYLRSLTPKEQLGCLELFSQSGPGCSDAGRD